MCPSPCFSLVKRKLQAFLQHLLGFKTYLLLVSIFRILTFRWNKKERAFRFFLSLLNETDNVLDIGAGIGVMTVLLSKKCKKGTIYSFEPIPDNFYTLKRVVKLFGCKNVVCFNMCLGTQNKKVRMIMPITDAVKMYGLSYVLLPESKSYRKTYKTFDVTQKRLDDLPALKEQKINAIKIDVENYENYVIKGAYELLTQNKPLILCEIWNDKSRLETFALLKNMGYTLKYLKNNRLNELVDNNVPSKAQDFFFIPH